MWRTELLKRRLASGTLPRARAEACAGSEQSRDRRDVLRWHALQKVHRRIRAAADDASAAVEAIVRSCSTISVSPTITR
ncbi:MAG TPA: hypothetical protein VHJ58_18455 [Vicinamibacterales bacterium]|nr:hypothetical protein [Vicinamibacterales bacterium]